MKRFTTAVLLTLGLFLTGPITYAHDKDGAHEQDGARYIANEGLMASHGDIKVLFDPFQVSGFGTYLEPSGADLSAIMAGSGEFAGIDAVFISHAHRDHFSAPQMIAYLIAQPKVKLIAPSQALAMMQADPSWDDALTARMHLFDMDYGDTPQSGTIGNISYDAVRIAHAGWPAHHRLVVQNMVYRVTLGAGGPVVMHMGDADPNTIHYTPFVAHWDAKRTHTAFPPYWFLTRAEGQQILGTHLNVDAAIGIHVPIDVPADLAASGADYFSVAGEARALTHDLTHDLAHDGEAAP